MSKPPDLLATAELAADLLEDFHAALSGTGGLGHQSLHLGANKLYRTLARDIGQRLRRAVIAENTARSRAD
jgi:hypothetical protein